MDVRQLQSIVLTNTYTKTDYLRRLTILREFLENKFYKEKDLKLVDFLTRTKVSQHDRETLEKLDVNFFNLFTVDNLYTIINGLTAALKALPILTLYLAVILDEYQLDELGKWFRQNLNPELIMDVRCNPTLVSGCSYVWNNKYKDLSLHYFLSQKQELINKIIDAYTSQKI